MDLLGSCAYLQYRYTLASWRFPDIAPGSIQHLCVQSPLDLHPSCRSAAPSTTNSTLCCAQPFAPSPSRTPGSPSSVDPSARPRAFFLQPSARLSAGYSTLPRLVKSPCFNPGQPSKARSRTFPEAFFIPDVWCMTRIKLFGRRRPDSLPT